MPAVKKHGSKKIHGGKLFPARLKNRKASMNSHSRKPKAKILKQAGRWFARTRAGDFSEADRTRLAAWLEADPAHRAAFTATEKTWEEAGLIDPSLLENESRTEKGCFLFRPRLQLAGLAVLMILGLFFFRPEMERAWLAVAGEEKHYATRPGETRTVTLEDGSILEMNANTSFTARCSWWKRRIDLGEGEIFLRVRREPWRPFEVASHQGLARVLGTSFHVRSRGGRVSVDVEEGLVRVETSPRRAGTPARSVELRKGEGVDYGWAGDMAKTRKARLEESTDWRGGKIVFRSMPLAEVLQKLEDYHNVRLKLADPALGGEHFTGVFRVNDLDEILEAVALSFSLTTKAEPDGTLVLAPKRR